MILPLLDLHKQYHQIKAEIDHAVIEVLDSGSYIMGPKVQEFETNMASKLSIKHAIGVASGSDALILSLHALDIKAGSKIIIPTFTFFATAGAVMRLGATPLFVDIEPDTCNIDLNQVEDLLKKDPSIRAIIPVHIFGLPVDMVRLMSLAQKYNLFVIEDACQAVNSTVSSLEVKAGTVGDAGCFSFFPSKNLGCYGDGGMIVTNHDKIANRIRILRVHGSSPKYYHKEIGYNSRLDAIQAAILNVKLRYLDEWTDKRRKVASLYNREFLSRGLQDEINFPMLADNHVFHQYCIQIDRRDDLAGYLKENGVGTSVYYPLPLHLQECFQELGYKKGDLPTSEKVSERILALPIDPELDQDQIVYIVNCIHNFITDNL